ncbi:methylmalonate-semialdehyde dehydrogenase (acylating) [Gordonia spumicola]|uniref:methylmalonate-semialdehyde dehydrogenase (CoA acylating) n=1 Tax=Gordonia spumicola TaxID=589161 RepID=A0A7I9V8K8_9ACTN|nr:aldehyde dehydrogenase family protein [Gordonia spumicola]GEE01655.1 methylmalonate-semialdehyde dehydrogenase (acylating) [Gordonia spumicola]
MTTTAFEIGTAARNIIGGEFATGTGDETIDVYNPTTGALIDTLRASSIADADAAVAAAEAAFDDWSGLSLPRRVAHLIKVRAILDENIELIAATTNRDHGKTLEDARGEVVRAMDFLDTAIAAPMIYHADSISIAPGLDARRVRESLGVCLAVTPSNFPVMNTVQFTSWALVTGNTLIIKASEADPIASTTVLGLIQDALPKGVLNLVHGHADIVKHMIAHPSVQAVSCITSSPTAKAIYAAAAQAGKRVQANGGAKNPIVIAEDADIDVAVNGIIMSAYGMAGQRCLAGDRLVVIGDVYDKLLPALTTAIDAIVTGDGAVEGVTMGPVISAGSRDRLLQFLAAAQDQGATFHRDGRDVIPVGQDTAGGYFLGPTLIEGLEPGSDLEAAELFGPVLVIHRVPDLAAAIALSNNTDFGNAASIFTRTGAVAAEYERRVRAGNVGVNTFPGPAAFITMGGYGTSFYGDSHVCGAAPLDFFTDQKLVVTRW